MVPEIQSGKQAEMLDRTAVLSAEGMRPNYGLYSESSMTFGSNKGFFTRIMGGVKWFFSRIFSPFRWVLSKVFYCKSCSGLFSKSRLETLKELKEAAEEGAKKFETLCKQYGSGEEHRFALRTAWQEAFDRLPGEVRDELFKAYFLDLAGAKDLPDQDIREFVRDCFKSAESRRSAGNFVRNLFWDQTPSGCSVDPVDPKELPRFFAQIVKGLENEIDRVQES